MRKLISKDQAVQIIRKIKINPKLKSNINIKNVRNHKSLNKIISPINLPELPSPGLDGYVIPNLKKTRWKIHKKEIVCGSKLFKPNKDFAYKVNTGSFIDSSFKYFISLENANTSNEILTFSKKDASKKDIKKIGEDLKKNALILNKDDYLDEFKIALLASVGIKKILSYRKLKVGIFSIGDELIDSNKKKITKSKIFDSNKHQIINFLKNWPVHIKDLGLLKDNENSVSKFYKKNVNKYDLIISSGGSSTSDKDFISSFFVKNFNIIFQYIKIKPGRPSIFAKFNNTYIFSLPGNPLAVTVNLLFIVSEFLNLFASGKKIFPELVTSGFEINKKNDFNNFYRVKINSKKVATLYNSKGSAKLVSISKADALLEIPKNINKIKKGDRVKVFRF
ncbi:MAG: hypothetical protein CMI90_03685 [Pelagibacteraceae bacterium]|nr:hypothetical protein [Pelagibacteraceae bacterium]